MAQSKRAKKEVEIPDYYAREFFSFTSKCLRKDWEESRNFAILKILNSANIKGNLQKIRAFITKSEFCLNISHVDCETTTCVSTSLAGSAVDEKRFWTVAESKDCKCVEQQRWIENLDRKILETMVFQNINRWATSGSFDVGCFIGLAVIPIGLGGSLGERGMLNFNAISVTSICTSQDKIAFIGKPAGDFTFSMWRAAIWVEKYLEKKQARQAYRTALDRFHAMKLVFEAIGEDKASGPSSGSGTAVGIISALFGVKIENGNQTAFTGEVTTTGEILRVGGVCAKITAAANAGLKKVFVPKENEKDTTKMTKEWRSMIEIVHVSSVDEMIPMLFPSLLDQ